MPRTHLYTRDTFIKKAKEVYGDLYDYCKVEYKGVNEPVLITDPDHGDFWQRPNRHIVGRGHPNRRKGHKRVSSGDDFIKYAKQKHGDLYDYSKVIYVKTNEKVCIIDPKYGEFWINPADHLSGKGNPERGRLKSDTGRRVDHATVIKRFREAHGDLYDYSKMEYISCDFPVLIIHPTLGEFRQRPYLHWVGCGHPDTPRKSQLDNDHIIPIGIVLSRTSATKFERNRPLVKFLNSDINLRSLANSENITKNDTIIVRGKRVRASAVRNLYHIIHEIVLNTLHIDISDIIEEDKKYILDYFAKS